MVRPEIESQIISLRQKGLSDDKILIILSGQGFKVEDVDDTFEAMQKSGASALDKIVGFFNKKVTIPPQPSQSSSAFSAGNKKTGFEIPIWIILAGVSLGAVLLIRRLY